MRPIFRSDFAKIHQRARELNKQAHKREGTGDYEAMYQKAVKEFKYGKGGK